MPRYISCYKRIGFSDLDIKTKATRVTKATKAIKATNNLSILIKLGLVGGFFSLFFIIGTSTLPKYLD